MRLRNTSRPGTSAPASDSGSPGRASANASSTTTTRPGRASARDRVGGVQDAGRVGGVADDDEVRVVGDVVGVQAVAVGLVGEHADDRHPGRAQRGLGLGEPGVHDGRQPRAQRREQREALRAAGEHEHLVGPAAVPGGDGVAGPGVGGGGRVAGEAVEGGDEPVAQPARRGVALHVDGEVEQAGRDLGVAVVAQAAVSRSAGWVVGCAPCGVSAAGAGSGASAMERHPTGRPAAAEREQPRAGGAGTTLIDGETSSPLSAPQSRVVPDGTTAPQGEIP